MDNSGAPKVLRALGIDSSLRSTGLGVVFSEGSRLTLVEYGLIKNASGEPLSGCLRNLYAGITGMIKRTGAGVAVLEGGFFSRNARTAMILGEARGTAITACATLGLPVYEYSPRRVKQAIGGTGAASKEQLRKMAMSLLGLTEEPPEDAGDALAIAICHLHNMSGHAALAPEPI